MHCSAATRAFALLLWLAAALPLAGAPPAAAAEPSAHAEGQDDAWARYEAAVSQLARGEVKGATAAFRALVAASPDHPAALKAQARLDDLATRGDKATLRLGRAELALGQTTHGAVIGAEICVLVDCSDGRVWSAVTLAGAGLGLTASLLATRDGIHPSQAAAINTGMLWGTWSGYSLFGAASRFYDDDANIDNSRLIAALLGGQLGGMGLGYLAHEHLGLTTGQSAGAFAGGIWTSAVTGMLWLVADDDVDTRVLHGGLFALSQLGFVGGYFLTRHHDVSRSRVFMVHLGGVSGAGLGALTALLIGGDGTRYKGYLVGTSAGILTGLGLTWFLTRHWDAPDLPVELSLSPTRGGALASLRGSWR